ncbi:MAG: putative lipid II flippase FtsW [Thermodesulfobacteriota bacterium]
MAEQSRQARPGYDYGILIPTLLLLGFGLVAIYSASSFLAEHRYGDSYFFLKRQAAFCLLGLCMLIVTKNVSTDFYTRMIYPFLLFSLGLLVLLKVPGMAMRVGGASRWLHLGGLSFQPSELAKLALALYLAYSMAKKSNQMGLFTKGLMPHLLMAGLFMGLIILQPDLGSCIIIGCWLMVLLFVGGVNLFHIVGLGLLSAPVLAWLILRADYRLKRWWTFLNPWDDPQGLGFQIIHSFLAFGSGGVFGVGLGNSKQKLFYLPESHTDFILSIIAEELGLVGLASVVVLFSVLILRGIRVALDAPDLYGSYLALGITSFLALQVLINMGVVLGLLPTKGLTLPLVSYGGSSLVITLMGIGMLLNISSRST